MKKFDRHFLYIPAFSFGLSVAIVNIFDLTLEKLWWIFFGVGVLWLLVVSSCLLFTYPYKKEDI